MDTSNLVPMPGAEKLEEYKNSTLDEWKQKEAERIQNLNEEQEDEEIVLTEGE